MSNTALNRFRLVAFLEGCSFILIGLTMILKYKFQIPEPNYIVGMIHGLLFIAYVFMLAHITYMFKWSFTQFCFGFAASLVPFGTFYADRKLFSKQGQQDYKS